MTNHNAAGNGSTVTRYLTGVDSAAVRAVAHEQQIGLLVTPDTKQYVKHIDSYPYWAADNACFAHPEDFNTESYLAWLDSIPQAQRATCLYATAPDVVGDPVKTMERSAPVLPEIRARGFKAAWVAQDGCERLPIPWDTFDVVFLGGSTEWKLSPQARTVAMMARQRGKHVHMGRVNSYKRLAIAHDFGCQTADGTFLKYGPKLNLDRMLGWFAKLADLTAQQRLAYAR